MTKVITIGEFVKSFTQTPPSTTPIRFVLSGHTPLEPARDYLEQKIGVKLPGDEANAIENEFVNNPQKAVSVLRAGTADSKALQKAYDAVKIHETLIGDQVFRRPKPVDLPRPSSVKPVKHWLPKNGQMTKIIELNENNLTLTIEPKGLSIDGPDNTIKLFVDEEQIGLYNDILIHIPKNKNPEIKISFIGSDLKESDKLILSNHLKNRISKYAALLRKIPGIVVQL